MTEMIKEIISKVKFLAITVAVSAVIGLFIGSFLVLLNMAISFREVNWGVVFFLPLVSVLTTYLYKRFNKGSEAGNNLIIDSINLEKSYLLECLSSAIPLPYCLIYLELQ